MQRFAPHQCAEALAQDASLALSKLSEGQLPDGAVWAPGRIEIVGKHTDYAGGKSLVCAIDRGLVLVFVKRMKRRLRLVSCDNDCEPLEYDLEEWKASLAKPANAVGWSKYISSIVEYFSSRSDFQLGGVDIAIKSNLPQDAGLSSSSALVCGVAAVLTEVSEACPLPIDDLGKIESGKLVGTRGGSQDHAAIMSGKCGQLALFSYRGGTRQERSIEMDPSLCFVVAVSGVTASKTGNAMENYNRLAGASEGEKVARATQETNIAVPLACHGFQYRNASFLKAAIALSQRHAELTLRTSVEETEWLPRKALALGAIGATTFGAGFGGSVYAIVPQATQKAFMQKWKEAYIAAFPSRASSCHFFVTRPSAGAARFSSL